MKTSVILSTYNSPLWLEKVLWGYACQTVKDFEIIVAEDGSTSETAALVSRVGQETGLTIRHVWQNDEGFRKCRILNKAVLQASGEYLIFSDGDCIPRKDFVEVHIKEARPGHYLSGSYFKLPMDISRAITLEDVKTGRCFDAGWLRRQGLSFWRKTYKISASPTLARWLNRLTTTKCNLKGSNASVWKADVLAVNGFDERMPWGGEDREFGVRLINYGIRPRHVRFNAIVVHLDHARGYVDPEQVTANKLLRLYNEKRRVKYTDHGIIKPSPSPS
jgi:glycosyltransferase involved in cell wall biosynthesis